MDQVSRLRLAGAARRCAPMLEFILLSYKVGCHFRLLNICIIEMLAMAPVSHPRLPGAAREYGPEHPSETIGWRPTACVCEVAL